MTPRLLRALGALGALGVVLFLSATTAGCTYLTGASCVASSNVPLEPGEYVIIHHPVKGEADSYNLFGVPLSSADMTKKATERAVHLVPRADALVNVSVTWEIKNYFYFLTITTTKVVGDAARTTDPERKKSNEAAGPPSAPK